MKRTVSVINCILLCLSLLGCDGDECRKYSKYTCKELEQVTFNVLFYFPNNDNEYDLGTAVGISECQNIAFDYANEKNLTEDTDWSYICCLKTKDSECAERHR